MIFKIDGVNKWWLFDGIERVCVHEGSIPVAEAEDYNTRLVIIAKRPTPADDLRLVTVSFRNGGEDLFLFNTRAYIMNDDGKTIDILPSM